LSTIEPIANAGVDPAEPNRRGSTHLDPAHRGTPRIVSRLARGMRSVFSSPPAALVARRAARHRLVVLCYHDVRADDDFSSWLRVSVSTFRAHLAALASLGRFVSPAALEADSTWSESGWRFLITFDDGYLNNLTMALPVLEEFSAPALFFVSTGHLVSGEPFWFDRLVTRIQSARLRRLDLSRFGLRLYTFAADDGAERWDDIDAVLSDVKRLGNPGHPEVDRLLAHMDAEYGNMAATADARLRPLRPEELRTMAKSPVVHVGSHGHRHEILTRLDERSLDVALTRSKTILEDLLDRPVNAIAYPNGDSDRRVSEACARAGYRHGYAARAGLVGSESDVWQLPRILIGGYDSASVVTRRIHEVACRRAVGRA
jgi:peptidoglycan/xylan/chitin deacetylase (PgdA/CDA1 family)